MLYLHYRASDLAGVADVPLLELEKIGHGTPPEDFVRDGVALLLVKVNGGEL